MKIKKEDNVLITAGKDRGRKGKVFKIFPKQNKIIVEGLNIIKKHVRPKKEGEKGQIVDMPRPIDVSNVKLICPKCKKPTKVGYKIKKDKDKQKKYRLCKKCNAEIL
ncbi:MAG: 50S ribosomal protein L24 [Candidatus Pacebacteria bacterium]|nr:50S ribosomal protein L24 [Candidatus Paceibacterota bacterium]